MGEIHHGLPEKYRDWFEAEERGFDINSGEFYYDLPTDKHRLKSGNGVHTNSSGLTIKNGNRTKNSNWNAIWGDYINKHPNATREQVLEQLARMENITGIGKYRAVKRKDYYL